MYTDRWQWIEDTQEAWEKDRPRMAENNSDLLQLAILTEGETNELSQAVLDYMIDPSLENKEEIAGELADVFLFCLQVARTVGINFFEAIRDKRAYNTARYSSELFSNGRTYDQGRIEARNWVKVRRFKDDYYSENNNVIFSSKDT